MTNFEKGNKFCVLYSCNCFVWQTQTQDKSGIMIYFVRVEEEHPTQTNYTQHKEVDNCTPLGFTDLIWYSLDLAGRS